MPDIVVSGGLRARLETLAGHRRDRLLLAVLIVAVSLGALALWMRGAPARIAPPARAGAVAQATPEADRVIVHVAGAVRRPGLYELPIGARVADALKRARPVGRADVDALNLAEPLVDGSKITVPLKGAQSSPSLPGVPAPTPSLPTPVNINTADQTILETIPGIGPVTATAIIDYRTEAGSFSTIEELLDVSGIGPATLESIRPYVTI